ncbi:MAG: sigma-70 family RNA polymerase sigma factor [Armatimonadetes bacterium]|nr:sigma-70 family RNA polymerase sigma factor [Armatimonadota bacterium]
MLTFGTVMNFDAIIDKYEKPIYNLIYRLVGDRDEAADLTQETFVAAYRTISEFRGDASIYTWLYRIAINKCKNAFKAREKRRDYISLEMKVDIDEDHCTASSDLNEPAAVIERKELREQIELAISQLPFDYRIVAVLRDLHGLSYDEIARAAGLSVDVVRTRLARARAMLRRRLEAYLEPL